jgi:protein-tyrosine phosphatase
MRSIASLPSSSSLLRNIALSIAIVVLFWVQRYKKQQKIEHYSAKYATFAMKIAKIKQKRLTSMMHRILFVCHGNICRSPMAEFVMKDLVRQAGREDDFYIESAATSTEEIGNGVYPPARRKLAEHGIGCSGKTARQMTRSDYDRFDLLIGMDSWNIRNMQRICGGDPEGKIVMLMDFTRRPGDVADPWYTGDFEATWRDVLEGCQALLDQLD